MRQKQLFCNDFGIKWTIIRPKMQYQHCKTCFIVFVHFVDVSVAIKAPTNAGKKFSLPFSDSFKCKKNYVILAAVVNSNNFTWSESGGKKFSAHVR